MLIILAIAITTLTVPAFAKTVKTNPYGFTWLDEEEDIWYFQLYEYDNGEDAYEITDYAYLDGNKLYDKKGKLIVSNVYAMDNDPEDWKQPTVAFYKEKLYFITKTGNVCRMDSSTDSDYSKNTSISNVKYFTLDAEGLGSKASSSYLSNMSFSGSYSRGTSSDSGYGGSGSDKEGDYVLTYAYNGDPTKTAYDAYYNDELLISIYCKGSNVWVETEKLLLSETCVGAKFVGYSKGYLTILYDMDGTMYCIPYDDWDEAYPISFNEAISYYTKDDDGFIETITTTRKTYNLEDLIEEYGYDDYEFDGDYDDDDDDDDEIDSDIDSVKNSTSKAVAYRNSSKVVATLEKSNNYLYWEDEKLENSYKPSYFGITEEGYPVWINNDDELYYFNGRKEKLIEEDVTLLRYDNDGFAYQYKIGSKTYTIDLD
jgi:hypothetical protein